MTHSSISERSPLSTWLRHLAAGIARRREACPVTGLPPMLPILGWILVAAVASQIGCSASHHPTQKAALGTPANPAIVESTLASAGPIRFTRIVAAEWAVARSGLLNLDHPAAKAAGLEDRSEPIEIYFYLLEHPTEGDFIVDSGVASAFGEGERHPGVSPIVAAAMNLDALNLHVPMREWLEARPRGLAGVFLTHLHLDHIMGLPDIAASTPIYVGPGETEASAFLNLFSRGTIDSMIERDAPLLEWPFASGDDGSGPPMLDVFGDGSLFVMHVPGHTPGSVSFLVRSTEGPRLLVGDTSHTRWGWEHGVEPGTYTMDHESNRANLAWLRSLAASNPELEVHLGHQRLVEAAGGVDVEVKVGAN